MNMAMVYDDLESLTLIIMVLIISRPIQHAEDLEDVAVAIIAVELVAGAVEAEHQLPRPTRTGDMLSIRILVRSSVLIRQD